MKILYCTDFSDSALFSFEKSAPFLKEGSKFDVISVIEPHNLTHLSLHPHSNLEIYKKNREENLEELKTHIKSKGFELSEFYMPEGHADEEIIKQSQIEDYNLVIIGSHSKKGHVKWLGSTSRKVVTKLSTPILITKFNEEVLNKDKEILFAVDGSENSYNSVEMAFELLNLENARIEILHVKQGKEELPVEITSDLEWLQRILAMQDEQAFEIFNHTSFLIKEKGFDVSSKVILEGNSAREILKYTEKSANKLIVMGSHGREGISQLLLGSVSKRVLDNTVCSVLIIPTKRLRLA